MVEPGAVDDAATQLRELLGIADPAAVPRGDERPGAEPGVPGGRSTPATGDPGELTLRIANAAFLQEGYPFEPDYLDTIGRYYGSVLNEVDFASDPDAVADEINAFVADATEDRIPQLIADGVLTPDHVLALVNALYLNASWQQTFDEAETEDGPFTTGRRLRGRRAHARGSATGRPPVTAGSGATKEYVGGLQAQFVLPDEGRFDEVAADLPAVFEELRRPASSGPSWCVPRFETRFETPLTERPAGPRPDRARSSTGNLLGIADDDTLVLTDAIHQTYLAHGRGGHRGGRRHRALAFRRPALPVGDAGARWSSTARSCSGIHDTETDATLFLGRVDGPHGLTLRSGASISASGHRDQGARTDDGRAGPR